MRANWIRKLCNWKSYQFLRINPTNSNAITYRNCIIRVLLLNRRSNHVQFSMEQFKTNSNFAVSSYMIMRVNLWIDVATLFEFKRRNCSNVAQIENIFARLFQEEQRVTRVPWWNSHALCTTCVHAFALFLPAKVIHMLRYRTFEIERSIGKWGFCKRRPRRNEDS